MRKKYADFVRTEPERRITAGQDGVFLRHLKFTLLRALKEEGLLTEAQYKIAAKEMEREGPHHRKQERGVLP